MASRKRTTSAKVTKTVAFDLTPPTPPVPERIAFVPAGKTYIARGGAVKGPFTGSRWVYEDEHDVYTSGCLTSLLSSYVPNEVQDESLLLKLADTYRAAMGL